VSLPPIAATGSHPSSTHGSALLRVRTSRYGLFAGAVGGVFLASRVGSALFSGAPERLLTFSVAGHVMGVAAMLALFVLARRADATARDVRITELVCTAVACASYCALVYDLPQAFRPDAKLAQGLAIQLLGRAVYVPSSARRTAALSAIVTVPYVAAIVGLFESLDPSFVASLHAVQDAPQSDARILVEIVGEDLLWWAGTVGVSTSISAVIYGLRREVSAAKQLGQYTLLEELGHGGMGVVYRARHGLLRRQTAIKLLPPDELGEEGEARFEREVRATAALSHPNTVTIFDYGHTPDGQLYYAMELLDGATLTRVVELSGPLPAGRVAHILAQVADALTEAHGVDFVHRDIKPDNVLLTRQGGVLDHVKVVDFGLVKEQRAPEDGAVTAKNTILGTPLYMAPEIIRAGEIDGRADLYALGAVGYYLLTGEHVFAGDTVVEICAQHLERVPEPPSARLGEPLPDDLERIVLDCLAKAPGDRPADARSVRDRLRGCACAREWTDDDASRWWRDFGPELEPQIDPHARTLEVDLAGRV